ncbi:bifunctional phosphopantothenoylcysteine decarboxylase/phosphopantothenate--cysteine ligase CoaBC [Hydrogenivirga sp. 128-5-R1-1]|uniref:bifunctional phosphopantothenoylcysteine decarboxylase/phosphopantothenate--cysteine ligase CoaBC n=1 Tax=Hydrogenivirga sp. 128-5-R1-1 TaxID=392423 RepID=UPI00015EF998|nr:bifunctional phosphopantothenoylcysteine decarboxylase/phosphopantothenate--cysteine ligase CoaBC [Hydrogenivirga sp. 128-5-R1-1]EDP75208.1 pantothenate metabolism flavoprotein [Hydrogenivirga sp. 128-5-R1-1]
MRLLEGRRVLLGVTGGIAVYKSAQLVRELKKEGAEVKVIMTPFARKFVGELTFETLSGNKVFSNWSDEPLAHINLARWAEVFLIAPCTVNTLSKLALGIGDNLLTTTALAYNGKLLIAPAANTVMYKNPAVQENLKKLKDRGVIVIEPEWGVLACEEEGEGKLASEDRLLDWVCYALKDKPLKGKRVLITCGATREYIDPVRFISNDSSGEMGFSLARVARWLGAEVKVIAGFTTAKEPPEVYIERVKTAEDMLNAVLKEFENADVVIMNSAVADYRPKEFKDKKIKKKETLTLELVKTPDILEDLGRRKKGQFLVGFALETDNILQNAKEKLRRKNLDMIVANPSSAMGSENYKGWIIAENSEEEIPPTTKLKASQKILRKVAEMLSEG